jgi:sugar phosphate isomerase/epimerase
MCLEEGLCLCNPSAQVRSQVKERLFSLIELAAASSAPLIIGGVRGSLSGGEAEKAEQRASALVILRECAARAGDLDTQLFIEPINRYETNFVNSADEAMNLIDEIGHPAVRLLLDTFHMNIEEADPLATIRKAGSGLGYVHLADNNRRAPGQGHIDFPALIQALTEIGYEGYLSAEILPSPDDATAASQTARYLQPIMGNRKVQLTV